MAHGYPTKQERMDAMLRFLRAHPKVWHRTKWVIEELEKSFTQKAWWFDPTTTIRLLRELERDGKVQSVHDGRSLRWSAVVLPAEVQP